MEECKQPKKHLNETLLTSPTSGTVTPPATAGVICPQCGKTYKNKESLSTHIYQTHGTLTRKKKKDLEASQSTTPTQNTRRLKKLESQAEIEALPSELAMLQDNFFSLQPLPTPIDESSFVDIDMAIPTQDQNVEKLSLKLACREFGTQTTAATSSLQAQVIKAVVSSELQSVCPDEVEEALYR